MSETVDNSGGQTVDNSRPAPNLVDNGGATIGAGRTAADSDGRLRKNPNLTLYVGSEDAPVPQLAGRSLEPTTGTVRPPSVLPERALLRGYGVDPDTLELDYGPDACFRCGGYGIVRRGVGVSVPCVRCEGTGRR